jgi:hypothetical protein
MNEQFTKEILDVKELGEKIGYGNMMAVASALWRKSLKDKGYPTGGAFIPVIGKPGEDDIRYDGYIEKIFSNQGEDDVIEKTK